MFEDIFTLPSLVT